MLTKRDRRTSLRERRHHCLEHRVWDHTPERAPEGCTIGISAYLPARMDRSFYRARHKPPVPYLFDPRGAGWLLLRMTSRGIFPRMDYRRGRGLVGTMGPEFVTAKTSMVRPSRTEMRVLCPFGTLRKSSPTAVFPEMFTIELNPLSSHRSPVRVHKTAVKSAKN
jgi:hypothetical protein